MNVRVVQYSPNVHDSLNIDNLKDKKQDPLSPYCKYVVSGESHDALTSSQI